MTLAPTPTAPALFGLTAAKVRAILVSMVFITSFFVKMEPAPSDLFFMLALAFCLTGGLRFTPAIMPLFLLLLTYNVSVLISYTMIPYDMLDSKAFIFGLVYTTMSGVFFAAYISEDPLVRYQQIAKAYWVGATIGGFLGLVSYFKVEPLYTYFPDFGGRALGGYKDPNVFSTWLVLPMVTMLQAFILGTLRLRPIAILIVVERAGRTVVDDTIIGIGGSCAEYINHSCEPNLKTRIVRQHILYYSTRPIAKGEERTVDYRYDHDTDKMRCYCGASGGRGTMNLLPPKKAKRPSSRP